MVDGLDPKLAYSYRLIAFNQAGSSEPSEVVGPVVVGMKEGFADSQPVPPWPCHPWPAPSPHRARTVPPYRAHTPSASFTPPHPCLPSPSPSFSPSPSPSPPNPNPPPSPHHAASHPAPHP